MAIENLTLAEKQEIVMEWVESTPLQDMGPVLTALANKVYCHRLTHKGYVPPEVFEQLLGPVTVSVQLVVEVLDAVGKSIGFALRLREADEVGDAYKGKYHNVCCSLRWLDDINTALARNAGQMFHDGLPGVIEDFGITYHHESPRRNMDLTFMHLTTVSPEKVPSMLGTWRIFSHEEIAEMVGKKQEEIPIVLSNVAQLCWVADPERKWIGVLHDTFPQKLLAQVPEWMRE